MIFNSKLWVVGLVAFVVVPTAVIAAPNQVPARGGTTTDKASVVSVHQEVDGGCSDAGVIRWKAVKGVDSYTVVFNDAAYAGAEQRVAVGEPFAGDNSYPAGSPLNAPGGMHQLVWTGGSYSPPCSAPVDYSGRLTNARVEYAPEFGVISGRVVDPRGLGVPDVQIKAKGKASLRATTEFDGDYRIEVPAAKVGTYEVTPDGKGFDPESKRVTLSKGKRAEANFRTRCGGGKSKGRGLLSNFRQPKSGLYESATLRDLQLHYSCQGYLRVLIQFQTIGPLVCSSGVELDVAKVGGLQFRKVPLESRSFTLQSSGQPFTSEPAFDNPKFKVSGEFTGDETANVRYSFSGIRGADKSTCSLAGRTTVKLANRDDSPFDGND